MHCGLAMPYFYTTLLRCSVLQCVLYALRVCITGCIEAISIALQCIAMQYFGAVISIAFGTILHYNNTILQYCKYSTLMGGGSVVISPFLLPRQLTALPKLVPAVILIIIIIIIITIIIIIIFIIIIIKI